MPAHHRRPEQDGSIERNINFINQNKMKTSYGLEFNTVTEINPQWSNYDKTVAKNHLANVGVIVVDAEYGQPIDNECDLEEIYPMIEKEKTDHSKNE